MLAVLTDNRIAVGSFDDDSISWDKPQDLEIQKVSICAGRIAILTGDGHVLVGSRPQSLSDITQEVHEIFGGDKDIRDISCGDREVMIMTRDAIALVCFSPISDRTITSYKSVHRFQQEINLCPDRWPQNKGLVRTVDNSLFWVEDDRHYTDRTGSPDCLPVEAVEFDEAASISEIRENYHFTMLLMQDGRVLTSETPGNYCHKPFKPIVFPYGECIAKIIQFHEDIFFIGVTGNCYHLGTGADEWGMPPVLLNRHVVEDVCRLGYDIAIHCDNGLRILYTPIPQRTVGQWFKENKKRYRSKQEILKQYMDGTRQPQLLTFPGDNIVSSIRLRGCTYFITDEGHALWTSSLDESVEPVITRDMFFDANPLVVKRSACSIRSAGSLINK